MLLVQQEPDALAANPQVRRPEYLPALRHVLAFSSVLLTRVAWIITTRILPSPDPIPSSDLSYSRAIYKLSALLIGTFIAVVAIAPDLASLMDHLRQSHRRWHTVLALSASCGFLASFIVRAGRWQFGGFDYGPLLEEGWRLMQGQRAYVDFPATTPPLFNLGIASAFRLLGVRWDAMLYLTAAFSCVTFLWMYWLLRRLSLSRPAALGIAFVIQCVAMLTLSFWWYNNVTLILAAVAFLSTLAYVHAWQSVRVQASFCLSLALLVLTKPNIAGLTLIASIAVAILATRQWLRTLGLLVSAAALALSILAANHVSVPAMLAGYRAAAADRAFSLTGYNQLSEYDRYSTYGWIPALALPLFAFIPTVWKQFRQRHWHEAAVSIYVLLALGITCFGIATNGDFREVECTLLLAAGGVIAFGRQFGHPTVRRIYVALLFACVASSLYSGSQRLRVFSVGPHNFFEWQDNQNLVQSGALRNMRVSSTMVEVEHEIQLAVDGNRGPYFFGPRIDFNYAVLGLPSPIHFPAWWHPGTAFAHSDAPRLVKVWQDHQFPTLIFLKGDYTYYTPEFLDAIHRDYTEDDSYPSITVYHRRSPVLLQASR